MTIIESVRNYINQFNGLKQYPFYINFIDSNHSYNVEQTQGESVVEEDVLGNQTKQFLFVLASMESFGKDIADQIDASGFYEDFSSWIRTNNLNGDFPVLDDGRHPVEIETLGDGYIFESEGGIARYQIQCRLIYTQEV